MRVACRGSRARSSRSRTPGKHQADVGGQRASHFADAIQQRVRKRRHEQAREIGADLDRDRVDADQSEREFGPAHRAAPRALARDASSDSRARRRTRAACASANAPPPSTRKSGRGSAGTNASASSSPPAPRKHVGTREQLRREIGAERAVRGDARHHHAHRGRDQKRRQRRHQRVADREQCERVERIERRQAVVGDADDDAAGEVERDDHQRRDRIALDELAGAVHRAVEIGFALDELRVCGARPPHPARRRARRRRSPSACPASRRA